MAPRKSTPAAKWKAATTAKKLAQPAGVASRRSTPKPARVRKPSAAQKRTADIEAQAQAIDENGEDTGINITEASTHAKTLEKQKKHIVSDLKRNTKSSAARYQHTPFEDETSIRLLYLHQGKFDDDINLDLKVVSLNDLPPYCAISYVWGPPPHETPVFCHGKELLVSKSCVAVLRRLRSTTVEKVLWIDAICIDQSSLNERGHQVKLMCDVYSKAERTWIWLGESTSESDFMMDFLKEYNKVRKTIKGLSSGCRDELLLLEIEKLKEEERRLYGRESEELVQSLSNRTWFERVWTVQEYTLSRDAQFLCGAKAHLVSRLLAGIQSIIYRRRENGERTYTPVTLPFLGYLTQYRHIWVTIHANRMKTVNFTDLLVAGRQLKASDPKDAVFGLHGMLQKFQIVVPPPDYSKPVEDIYTEATKAAIVYDDSLAVLLHCSGDNTVPQLPSWVPDWSSFEYNGLQLDSSKKDVFEASGGSRASFDFVDEGTHQIHNILYVRGVIIDVLKHCAPETFPDEDTPSQESAANILSEEDQRYLEDTTMYKNIEAWMALVFKLSPCPTGEVLLQAFSRTLILDRYQRSQWQKAYPNFDVLKGLLDWLHSYRSESSRLDKGIAEGGNFSSKACKEEFLREVAQEDVEITKGNKAKWRLERSSNAIAFQQFIQEYMGGTLSFTTENVYMGQGLPGIQTGDQVILVAGVSRPLIARKVGERYRLIGPAYVHGVMDGEKWPKDESELVDIVFE